MAEIETFQGFFSYARHDAETDPKLIEALTARLEKRVSGKLTNARFTIWRDVNAIRTGQRWDERIGEAVRASHVFIVLMTPKWFESPYCRQEYQAFEAVEPDVGEYVVPLLARPIDRQVENFDQPQKDIQDSLGRRQYGKIIASDFLLQSEDQRDHFIDKIADDIEGMIQRLRGKAVSMNSAGSATPARPASTPTEAPLKDERRRLTDPLQSHRLMPSPASRDQTKSTRPGQCFISYVHDDHDGFERLIVQVNKIAKIHQFRVWHDPRTKPGFYWNDIVRDQIENSNIFILLVSNDYFTSGYINDCELVAILEQRSIMNALVIPVIYRECSWRGCFRDYIEVVPKNPERYIIPVRQWADEKQAFAVVANAISTLIGEWFGLGSSPNIIGR